MTLQKVGTFILADENLDRHSQRVLVNGVDLKAFRDNPVILYNHLRGVSGFFGETPAENALNLPIGIWKNVRRTDGQIKADAYIDMEDAASARIGRKIQKGILRAASFAYMVLAVSDAPEDKAKGQKGYTITKSEALEASIVDIPANPRALRMKSLEETAAKCMSEAGEVTEPFVYQCMAHLENSNHSEHNKPKAMNNKFDLVAWAKSFFGSKAEGLEDEEQVTKFLQEQQPETEKEEPETAEKALGDTPEAAGVKMEAVKAEIETAVKALEASLNAKLSSVVGSISELTKALEEQEKREEQEEQEADEVTQRLEALTGEIAALKNLKSGKGQPKKEAGVKVEANGSGEGEESKKAVATSVPELLELINSI